MAGGCPRRRAGRRFASGEAALDPERQRPAPLLLTGEDAGRLPPETADYFRDADTTTNRAPRPYQKSYSSPYTVPDPSDGPVLEARQTARPSDGKARPPRRNSPQNKSGPGPCWFERPPFIQCYDLAVRGNAVWTPAQKNIKEPSDCRFLSSRHCGKLSGSPFATTTSRKPNGRGTPSFSSKQRCKKATVPRGFERPARFSGSPNRSKPLFSRGSGRKAPTPLLQIAWPLGPLRCRIGPQPRLRAQGETDTVSPAPAPPKETQSRRFSPACPSKSRTLLPPRQAGLPQLLIPVLLHAPHRLQSPCQRLREQSSVGLAAGAAL